MEMENEWRLCINIIKEEKGRIMITRKKRCRKMNVKRKKKRKKMESKAKEKKLLSLMIMVRNERKLIKSKRGNEEFDNETKGKLKEERATERNKSRDNIKR